MIYDKLSLIGGKILNSIIIMDFLINNWKILLGCVIMIVCIIVLMINKSNLFGWFRKKEGMNVYKLKKEFHENNSGIAAYNLGEYYYSQAVNDSDEILVESIRWYIEAVKLGVVDASLRIADIYNFCNIPAYGIPNKDIALGIYMNITQKGIRDDIKFDALAKISDIRLEKNSVRANNNVGIDKKANRINAQVNNPIHRGEVVEELPVDVVMQMFATINDNNRGNIVVPIPVGGRNLNGGGGNNMDGGVVVQGGKGDSQNVHDSGVQRSMKQIVDKLRFNGKYNEHVNTPEKSKEEIETFIRKSGKFVKTKQDKAVKVLEYIMTRGGFITNAGTTERELMNIVWNRIHAPVNAGECKNMEVIFVDNLIDCMTSDDEKSIVCSSGRATRMLSTLEVLDADPSMSNLRPKWVIKEEMNGMAAKIRDDIVGKLGPIDLNAYNNAETSPAQEAIVDRIKMEITKAVNESYVTNGLIDKQEINVELEKIFAGL